MFLYLQDKNSFIDYITYGNIAMNDSQDPKPTLKNFYNF